MKFFVFLFALMEIGASDPLGDSVIWRTFQSLATLGILALVYKIASGVTRWENRLDDGEKAFRKLTHRVDDHSTRIFNIDNKQELPFNEFD